MPIARIVGVPLMFAGLLFRVAAVATPDFLSGDRDADGDAGAATARSRA